MDLKFNFKVRRWEVFSDYAVVRAGERQPSFVSVDRKEAEDYIKNVEGYHVD